jgi:hypothetical protein
MENPTMKTRKDLKEEYKNMKFDMGVFQIRNLANGKIYVGSSLDLKAFWNAQKWQLDFGMHRNAKLQADWKEFGAEQFSYEILGLIEQSEEAGVDYKKELKLLEELYVEELQPFDDKGYNQKPR